MAAIFGDKSADFTERNQIAERGVQGHPCFISEIWNLAGTIRRVGEPDPGSFESRVLRIPAESRILDIVIANNFPPTGLRLALNYRNIKPEGVDATWTAIMPAPTGFTQEASPDRDNAIFFSTLSYPIEFQITTAANITAGVSEFIKMIVVYGNM